MTEQLIGQAVHYASRAAQYAVILGGLFAFIGTMAVLAGGA